MASSPITSWHIDGEKVEAVTDFISLASKITLDGYRSHEIKGLLILEIKAGQHIKKQRHHFANKGRIVKAMVFPVVMYRCEICTIKKAECQRIDAFELWCWRRLESSLDCKEIKPVNLKGNQP